MFYENHSKICISAFCISFFGYLFSPSYTIPVSIQEVSAKEATTKTGSMESRVDAKIQAWGKEIKSEVPLQVWGSRIQKVPTCDADCKIRELTRLGIRSEISTALVTNCKEQDIEVVYCIKLWASIVVAESWWWSRCNKNWCFWILAKWLNYKTKEEWVKDWVKRFWKYWKNQKTPDSFYSNSPKWNPKTRYCMSERQPDWTMLPYCKNWHKHAWNIFNKLEKLF